MTASRWSPWISITPAFTDPPTPQRFFSFPADLHPVAVGAPLLQQRIAWSAEIAIGGGIDHARVLGLHRTGDATDRGRGGSVRDYDRTSCGTSTVVVSSTPSNA